MKNFKEWALKVSAPAMTEEEQTGRFSLSDPNPHEAQEAVRYAQLVGRVQEIISELWGQEAINAAYKVYDTE